MNISRLPWWKGAHGEWYVVAQTFLILLVVFGPKSIAGWPVWSYPPAQISTVAGGILLGAGFLLAATGILKQGKNIAAVPYPKDGAILIESGPYGIVRHPMYSGAIAMAFGWAFIMQSWLTFVYAGMLGVFFDLKARREEHWLRDKFSGYVEYQKQVSKLIPFIY